MQIRFHAHACIGVEGDHGHLLIDPWFQGDVFNDAWSLMVPPDLSRIDFDRLRFIWISHEHPDHLHFESLRLIRERTTGPVTVYYRRQRNANVREAVAKLGFEVVELVPHAETRISPDLAITLFPTRQDNALVIRAGDRVILDQNDCRLLPAEVEAIRRMAPRIDAWFFQFSLAGYYANADDHAGLARARAWHLDLIREYHEAFRPGIFVPFASFVRFSKAGNAHMNRYAVSLDDVIEALPGAAVQILWGGDPLLWEGWEARNVRNLALWRERFAAGEMVKPHRPVTEAEILRAAESLLREGLERELPPFRPPETHLQVEETGRALSLDFRRGRVAMRERPHPDRLAGIVPAEELLFFLKFPWGADTLNVSACFHVVDEGRWRRLLRFRHSLYVGTEKDEYRVRGMPWLVGRLARGLWNRARSVLVPSSSRRILSGPPDLPRGSRT